MTRPFIKMNGLGNDFVIIQPSASPFTPTPEQICAIADRIDGVGCDQVIALEAGRKAEVFMRIWNADGSEVFACGNAARCVAWLLMKASGRKTVRLETASGVLEAFKGADGLVTVDMGAPRLDWTDIPLAGPADTLELDLRIEAAKGGPGCVSMGNPHLIFFVHDAEATPVESLGPWLEKHQRFPEGVNVGFAQIAAPGRMRLRVWERGAGLTMACGTGACAAVVAAHRRGLGARHVTVAMDGGDLIVEWRESDDHVLMQGAVEVEFAGRLPDDEFASPAPSAVPPSAANDSADGRQPVTFSAGAPRTA